MPRGSSRRLFPCWLTVNNQPGKTNFKGSHNLASSVLGWQLHCGTEAGRQGPALLRLFPCWCLSSHSGDEKRYQFCCCQTVPSSKPDNGWLFSRNYSEATWKKVPKFTKFEQEREKTCLRKEGSQLLWAWLEHAVGVMKRLCRPQRDINLACPLWKPPLWYFDFCSADCLFWFGWNLTFYHSVINIRTLTSRLWFLYLVLDIILKIEIHLYKRRIIYTVTL